MISPIITFEEMLAMDAIVTEAVTEAVAKATNSGNLPPTIDLEIKGSANGHKCYYCGRTCREKSLTFYFSRRLMHLCDTCCNKIKPTPVGGVIGSTGSGLYRILARKAV